MTRQNKSIAKWKIAFLDSLWNNGFVTSLQHRRDESNACASFKNEKFDRARRQLDDSIQSFLPYMPDFEFWFYFCAKPQVLRDKSKVLSVAQRGSRLVSRVEKTGPKKKISVPSVVEVTEIRRGAAWWVNGKEALKAVRRKGAALSNPSCLPVSTEKPWNPGRWETDGSTLHTDCSGILVRFQWVNPPLPPSPLDDAPPPLLRRRPTPYDFIHCCCCIQHLIKSACRKTHSGGTTVVRCFVGCPICLGSSKPYCKSWLHSNVMALKGNSGRLWLGRCTKEHFLSAKKII